MKRNHIHAETPIIINSNGKIINPIEFSVNKKEVYMIPRQTPPPKVSAGPVIYPTKNVDIDIKRTTGVTTMTTTKTTSTTTPTTTTTPKPTTTPKSTTTVTTTTTTKPTTTKTTPTTTTTTTTPAKIVTTKMAATTESPEALKKDLVQVLKGVFNDESEHLEKIFEKHQTQTPYTQQQTHTRMQPNNIPTTTFPLMEFQVIKPTFRSKGNYQIESKGNYQIESPHVEEENKKIIISPYHDDVPTDAERYIKTTRMLIRKDHGKHVHGEDAVTSIHEDLEPDKESYHFISPPISYKRVTSPVEEVDSALKEDTLPYFVERKNKDRKGLLINDEDLAHDLFENIGETRRIQKENRNQTKLLIKDLEKLEVNQTDQLENLLSTRFKSIAAAVEDEIKNDTKSLPNQNAVNQFILQPQTKSKNNQKTVIPHVPTKSPQAAKRHHQPTKPQQISVHTTRRSTTKHQKPTKHHTTKRHSPTKHHSTKRHSPTKRHSAKIKAHPTSPHSRVKHHTTHHTTHHTGEYKHTPTVPSNHRHTSKAVALLSHRKEVGPTSPNSSKAKEKRKRLFI